METSLLINTSLITAFLAGVAALFAPCCIAVLMPTYLASIFQQRTRVLFMTFFFFLGILVVFLPLGLGFGGLGKALVKFHEGIFISGGVLLVLLALAIPLGLHPKLSLFREHKLQSRNIMSIVLLGVFSGLASACCAPVLAGVLTLSILPGSVFWGGMYALGYVLGMVLPLFLIAAFLDRTNLTDKFILFNKTFHFKGRQLSLASLLASLTFLAMGILILSLSLADKLIMDSSLQSTVSIYIAKYLESMKATMEGLPGFLAPLLLLLVLSVIIILALRRK